jgi:D-3-phosphoglycerate dehydrogenase / 2-oxoglutarate reductase
MSTRPKVLLLEAIHPVAREQLEREGFDVELTQGSLKEAELIERLVGVGVLGIRSKTQVTPKVLAAAEDLYAVGAFCIGTNQIALDAAMKRGVAVFNAPYSNTRSVAELVIAEIVMLSRQLGDRSMEMHKGQWRKVASGAHEVRGKTLGVVGYGHIGTQVGILAEMMGMRVVFFDVATKLPLGNTRACTTLEQMLEQSDFVTLHVPETPQTRGLFAARQLSAMRKGACLINASRGTVVDLGALAEALRSGQVAGAAVDVYPEEPEANSSDGFLSPLQGLKNVILTPHIGGSTLEAQESIGTEVATSLVKYVRAGTTTASVNFPNVELARTPNTHRVMNVHENVPGVLRDINRIVSDTGANIAAQVLSTNSDIGYLIMDFESEVGGTLTEAMKKLPTTIQAKFVA